MTNICTTFGLQNILDTSGDIFGKYCTLDWTGFEKCPNLTPLVAITAARSELTARND